MGITDKNFKDFRKFYGDEHLNKQYQSILEALNSSDSSKISDADRIANVITASVSTSFDILEKYHAWLIE